MLVGFPIICLFALSASGISVLYPSVPGGCSLPEDGANISHIAPMNTNTIAGSTIIFCRFSRCASVSGSRSFFGFPVSGAALFSFVGSFFVCSI